jgi:hypothetical protein
LKYVDQDNCPHLQTSLISVEEFKHQCQMTETTIEGFSKRKTNSISANHDSSVEMKHSKKENDTLAKIINQAPAIVEGES